MRKPVVNCDSRLCDVHEPFRIPDIVTDRNAFSCPSIMAFQQIDSAPVAGWMPIRMGTSLSFVRPLQSVVNIPIFNSIQFDLRTIGRRIQRQDALDRWIQRQAEDIVIVWTIGQTRRTNAYRLTIKRELPASEFRCGPGAGVRVDRDKALPSYFA